MFGAGKLGYALAKIGTLRVRLDVLTLNFLGLIGMNIPVEIKIVKLSLT